MAIRPSISLMDDDQLERMIRFMILAGEPTDKQFFRELADEKAAREKRDRTVAPTPESKP